MTVSRQPSRTAAHQAVKASGIRRVPAGIGSTRRLLRSVDSPDADDASDDGAVFARTALEIRGILVRTFHRGMEDVGECLLKTFYQNSPSVYRSSTPSKHASLRRLAKLAGTMELPVSATFLSTCIRMAVVARSLPRDASFMQLPISHRIELLRLPPEKIEAVATRVLEAQLPVHAVRTDVRKLLDSKPSGRGRPRTPMVLRAAAEIERGLGRMVTAPGPGAALDLAVLSSTQRAQLERVIERADVTLRELRKALQPRRA